MAGLFGMGLWLGMQQNVPLWALAAGLLLCTACVYLCHRYGRSRLYGVLGAVFFAGCLYTSLLLLQPLPAEGTYQLTGYVTGDVEVRDDGFVQLYLKDVRGLDETGREVRLSRAYLSMNVDGEEETALANALWDGDSIAFHGKLCIPIGQMNPYGFDFQQYLLQNGVRMKISSVKDLQVLPEGRVDFAGVMYRLRKAIAGHMDALFGAYAYYPQALLLGDKTDFPDEEQDTFADLGIAHVLAVSGLHVGLIAGVLMGLLRPLHLTPRQRTAVLAVFLAAYCALLEFSAPVVRASILLLLSSFRQIVRRNPDPLTFLAAAFLCILIVEPFSLLSLSFQMTFGAVAGMVLFQEPLEKCLAIVPRFLLRRELCTMLSATLGVLIPMTAAFHQLSLVSVVVSPIASLLIGLLLPAYAATTIIGAVYLPLGQGLALVLHKVLGWLPVWMERIAAWPYATIKVPAMPWMLAAGFVILLILCTRYVVLPLRRRLIAGALTVVLSIGMWQLTVNRDVCYIQLYEGQADCAIILDGEETVVIDTGNTGRDLTDYLLSVGRQVDTLVLTHLHSDHTGGVARLLKENVPIGRVLIPDRGAEQQVDVEAMEALALLEAAGVPVEEVGAGDKLTMPSGSIQFVWPFSPRSGQDANQYCLAALAELEDVRIMLTGDLTGEYEHYAAQRADILKVAHHGSGYSTYDAFLDQVKPKAALVTCAAGRVLPSSATLSRLESRDIAVYRTDETGAVAIYLRDGQYAVQPYLRE